MKTVYDYKTLTTITTITTIRLSEKCLRLWRGYDYERLTTMKHAGGLTTMTHIDTNSDANLFKLMTFVRMMKLKLNVKFRITII